MFTINAIFVYIFVIFKINIISFCISRPSVNSAQSTLERRLGILDSSMILLQDGDPWDVDDNLTHLDTFLQRLTATSQWLDSCSYFDELSKRIYGK